MTPLSHDAYEPSVSPYVGRVGLIYARVSSMGQRADAQHLRCAKFLEAAGIPQERAFSDKFTGGGDFLQRPAMRDLLAHIDANPKTSFLVVFDDLKRFARDTEFHIRLRQAFRSRNVMLACLNYNFDESPEGRFAEIVVAAQGELERHQNQRQVLQKMEARLKRGYWAFAHKKGYDVISTKEHGKFCVPNAEGRLLAEAFEGFASGRFVRRIDVAKFLVARGVWPRPSPEKYLEQVNLRLRDPFYCGDIEYPKWGVARRPGRHEPIVSREVFARVQARLDQAAAGKRVRQDMSEEFPLRGLLVCEACEKHLTAAQAQGRTKKYSYYYCQNRACERYSKTLRKGEVEGDFVALLERCRIKADAGKLIPVLFERSWSAAVATRARAGDEYDRAIKRLKAEMTDFARLAHEASTPAVRQAYEAEIEKAAVQIKKIEKERANSADLAVPYQTALEEATELLKNPVAIWEKVDPVEKQRLFFFLFLSKLRYGEKDRYQTAEKLSAASLFEEFGDANSIHVHSNNYSLNPLLEYLNGFWTYYQSSEPLQSALHPETTVEDTRLS